MKRLKSEILHRRAKNARAAGKEQEADALELRADIAEINEERRADRKKSGLCCWNCGIGLAGFEIKEQDEEQRRHGADIQKEREYYMCNDCNSRRDDMQENYRTATEWHHEQPIF